MKYFSEKILKEFETYLNDYLNFQEKEWNGEKTSHGKEIILWNIQAYKRCLRKLEELKEGYKKT